LTDGRLSGRRALITGAADGIGLGIARRFAAEGAYVVMADFDHEKAVAEARALTDAGHSVEAVFVDVTDKGAVATMMATAAPVDILVNNAYRGNGVARIEKKSDEDFLSALGMNLWVSNGRWKPRSRT
jgi:NAD(P)-dependent dehydrogenase (short-subunit alcohol dehydrogenase family)